jgi:hypothetical protein
MPIRKRWGRLALLSAACLIGASSQGEAAGPNWIAQIVQTINSWPPIARPVFTNQLLARAAPDECFAGIGQPYPAINQDGTCSQGQPKTNEAYVWGLTREQAGTLWFGTAANVICLVSGGYFNSTAPTQNKSWVCEFGQSQLAQKNIVPAILGDFRSPNAYQYNPGTRTLTKRTPAVDDPKNQGGLFQRTLGIRSAGSIGGIVFLAGPDLSGSGVNFFAFKASDGGLVAACRASGYNDIRNWVQLNGKVYAGIGTSNAGGVISWSGAEADPFKGQTSSSDCGFDTAARLPGDAAYVTTLGTDRLAVSAWPADFKNPRGAGIYIVDPTSGGSTLLWQPSNYEPDAVTGATYGGGAIAEWQGALYFMTMHVPGLAAVAHATCSDPSICFGQPANESQQLQLFFGTSRATSVWRVTNPKTTPKIDLLYGEAQLPAYDPASKQFVPRPTGFTPLFGHSGFGNPNNNYGWTAAVVNGKLMLGTLDSSYLFSLSLQQTIPNTAIPYPALLTLLKPVALGFGADLWRMDRPDMAAIPENLNGLGNYLNYGIRSMVTSADGKTLYVGTANPMNLEAKGGWELRALRSTRR